jgi:hypothetical protein
MGKEVVDNARKEAIITNRFQHKNIIQIVVCLVLPDCEGNPLIAYIYFIGYVYD